MARNEATPPPVAGGSPFDPISLEIMWSRLINITEECWITILRTAFSTIIGEAQDFGCEILDADAESIAHSPRSMPVFNLSLPLAVRYMLSAFPKETLRDGDVLITNDPWMCAGHLYDFGVVTPVFRRGRVCALIGSIAHASDIGGTRDSLNAREIYDEGLQVPPLKLYRAGELNDDLMAMIGANVRRPEMVVGDIQAQVSSNRIGADRLLAFMDEYGLESLAALAHTVQARAEQAMRDAIRAVPDGTYRSEVWYDGLDAPLRLPCAVTVAGDEITADFTGAPPQLPRGGMNCTYHYTAAHTTYALKSILTPEIRSNAGCYRPFRVIAPEGSVLNCRYPASVNERTHTGWYLGPAVFRALAEVLPDRVQAFTGLPIGMGSYGRDADGRPFNDHLFQGGGQGASAHGDGKSALLYPTSAANVSVEMFESRTPLVVECKELISDSGGPGRHRGGLGQRVRMRLRRPSPNPVLVDFRPHGMLVSTPGLHGGRPGRRARAFVVEDGQVREASATVGVAELRGTGERATIEIAGGSGFGDPAARPVVNIQADLDDGYVTAEGAAAYGAAVDRDGRVRR
ncbi:MAG TPA: hydantoinase B/oxoprolinase family protein [bacterium]|nr:hydantoinase B/oxoprolinase family protein [bacterium]